MISFCSLSVLLVIIIIIISRFASFTHWSQLVGNYWSLRDSKFPQVIRTLPSILANLNVAAVWMFTILSWVSSFSSPFFSSHQLHVVLPWPTCSTVFSVFWQGPSTCLYFCFILIFTLGLAWTVKSPRQQILFYFFIFYQIALGLVFWSGLEDPSVS